LRAAQPGAGRGLCGGDLARAHVLGDFGSAGLCFLIAGDGGEVEPFVGFDQVDAHARGAARIGHAEIEIGVDIAPGGIRDAAVERETRIVQAAAHALNPC
jgi:hypothetical protein